MYGTITTTLAGDIPAMFAVSPSGAVYYYSPAATADLAYQAINGIALGSATDSVERKGQRRKHATPGPAGGVVSILSGATTAPGW